MSYGGRGRGGGGGGRGEYYRNKYGGGGRGRGGGGRGRGRGGGGGYGGGFGGPQASAGTGSGGGSYDDLLQLLERIDGRQYPSYHDLETPTGSSASGWRNSLGYTLQVGRAQSDPFAPPTRCRVLLSNTVAGMPRTLYSNKIRRVATADYLLRRMYESCKRIGADNTLQGGGGWSGPKGGDVRVLEPTQHVLEQSAIQIDAQGNIAAQVTINLPARGRTVLGRAAWEILDYTLSTLVTDSLFYKSLDQSDLAHHVDSVEDQTWLQGQLDSAGLVAFVRNGAILPRVSGVDDRPMRDSVVPFQSPPDMEISFTLPNAGVTVSGLGVPKGITLICGGGFHGKSTLLQTLQVGVYSKIPGDGREFCVTSRNAMKIRAEDGRCVKSVDISSFINNLPFGKDTTCFSTLDASGSTSQASNIVESIENGADALLVDEDTCATNFMIRDTKMMQLVATNKEPITPFVHVVRSLYEERGISTVLVIGGAGDYFDVADHVLLLDCYKCGNATARAKEIVEHSSKTVPSHLVSQPVTFGVIRHRYPIFDQYSPNGKVKVMARGVISYGDLDIDLTPMEQLVSLSQTNAVASALQRLADSAAMAGKPTLREALENLDRSLDREGLDFLAPGQLNGGLTRPRALEIGAAVNRLRRDRSISQR